VAHMQDDRGVRPRPSLIFLCFQPEIHRLGTHSLNGLICPARQWNTSPLTSQSRTSDRSEADDSDILSPSSQTLT